MPNFKPAEMKSSMVSALLLAGFGFAALLLSTPMSFLTLLSLSTLAISLSLCQLSPIYEASSSEDMKDVYEKLKEPTETWTQA